LVRIIVVLPILLLLCNRRYLLITFYLDKIASRASDTPPLEIKPVTASEHLLSLSSETGIFYRFSPGQELDGS